MKNKKYLPNKKNKGKVPTCYDERVKYVAVGCGKCIECLKRKSREWQVRLQEEIRHNNECTFVTLTFSNESIEKLKTNIPNKLQDNNIATNAIRYFLERWRKKYGKSLKHWLITELGHTGTERIHLHGILWTKNKDEITKLWQYGWVYNGQYVNNKTINYIIKYVTKIDLQHKWFNPKILCSPGIGSQYLQRVDSQNNKFSDVVGLITNETYTTRIGTKIALPIYYRNKIYSEDEREYLWLQKLDKEERYIMGERIKVNTEKGMKEYEKLKEFYQLKNSQLGYGDGTKNIESMFYIKHNKIIKKITTFNKISKQKKKGSL